jgi:acetyl esterase/lipase
LADELPKQTFTYKTVGNVSIAADVYFEKDGPARPVIVWIHGGALITGSRTQVPRDLLELATQKKFVLVSIDYRLAPQIKLPTIAEDLQDAIAWIYEKGPSLFRADTRRVVIVGGSAGGYLTMLAGAIAKPKPTALVAYWGYGEIDGPWTRESSTHHGEKIDRESVANSLGKNVVTNTDDLAEAKTRSRYYRYLRQNGLWSREVTGLDPVTQKETLTKYCPVRQISRDYPPILMVHGTLDSDVPYACSTEMARELERQGVKYELLSVPNAEHGLRDGDPQRVREVRLRALQFIAEQLAL